MRLVRLWIGLLLACLSPRALAQPSTELLQKCLPPTHFESSGLGEIMDRAEREYKIIVFYIRNPGDAATPAMDRRVWNNPTLAAYVRWHGLAYKFDYPENPGLARRLGLNCEREAPAVALARVINGDLDRLGRPMVTLRNPLALSLPGADAVPDIFPGTLKVFESTDTELQALRARDPAWANEHDQLNPEPKPPPDPDPIYETGDEGAPAISDPEPLTGSPDIAGKIDVYARLDEARAAVANGDLDVATGLYTWLWEKGDGADPAFRSARRSVVAQEMLELAARREPSRERFRRLKSYYDDRLLWTTYERLGDWFLLNAVTGETKETVAYLDLFINDLDEGGMIAPCDLIAYRLLVGRDMWDNAWDLGEAPGIPPEQLGSETRHKPISIPVTLRARRIVTPSALGLAHDLDDRDQEKLDAFRAVFAVDECARLHAACLHAGREDDAWRVADTLLAARPDPQAKLALVATAVAAGEVHPRHADLLRQAALEGAPHPVLQRRVDEALRGRAGVAAGSLR